MSTSQMRQRLLIVGGSYAACELASHARENGYGEDILIVSEEPELPYHRPPLSKTYLKDQTAKAEPLKAEAFYAPKKIDLKLGATVTGFDPGAKTALLSDGSRIAFDTLALAVGARARKLACEGAELGNVFDLRSVADARFLRTAAVDAENVVIVGGGFIGLEIASALVQLQKQVTVIEAENRVLARVVAPELSHFFSSAHTARGVKLLTSRTVKSLVGESGIVHKVVLDNGRSVNADIVIVGIGSIPNVELTRQLGLAGDSGIVVDSRSRTSRENVFAAGDCALFRGPFNLGGLRLESVQNAIDQSRVAGAVIAGADKAYAALPWFWSDQYGLKLQIAGLPTGATERVVRPGTASDISVLHFLGDVCICVESVNRAREHMSARRLLAAGDVTKRALLDVDFDIAELLRRRSQQ
ncbi:NAD(P)/FAD-dependent oxidoreductase [Bradyrhizobium sp. CCBAU 53421]|uniref:NAD(P)/FAD-dependent oxidoreductase n=1 Tax=Bradyrhizobium sp. CCBAU 53421 TaxID=1325120 RepID=UPI00188A1A2D|nr:FAD-dependent oxidoreductase [Bradyrhizobium sp. CCBAU 53421]QOZ36501.1 NAD(P)/FAD-dependent oxidoreductase [Bradyrhizobium sp. CCBAU 53421]